jgi:hypothetical protein
MNIVATNATRNLARAIIRETADSGADATMRHLRDVAPEQFPALVAILAREASAIRIPRGAGFPIDGRLVVDVLTEDERRTAHAAYVRGVRDEWVIAGEREYQRLRRRNERAAKKAAA